MEFACRSACDQGWESHSALLSLTVMSCSGTQPASQTEAACWEDRCLLSPGSRSSCIYEFLETRFYCLGPHFTPDTSLVQTSCQTTLGATSFLVWPCKVLSKPGHFWEGKAGSINIYAGTIAQNCPGKTKMSGPLLMTYVRVPCAGHHSLYRLPVVSGLVSLQT